MKFEALRHKGIELERTKENFEKIWGILSDAGFTEKDVFKTYVIHDCLAKFSIQIDNYNDRYFKCIDFLESFCSSEGQFHIESSKREYSNIYSITFKFSIYGEVEVKNIDLYEYYTHKFNKKEPAKKIRFLMDILGDKEKAAMLDAMVQDHLHKKDFDIYEYVKNCLAWECGDNFY